MKGNPPSHRIYLVKEDEKEGAWKEIGAAWPHKDGKGYGIRFKGRVMRLVMREAEPKESRPRELSTKEQRDVD